MDSSSVELGMTDDADRGIGSDHSSFMKTLAEQHRTEVSDDLGGL